MHLHVTYLVLMRSRLYIAALPFEKINRSAWSRARGEGRDARGGGRRAAVQTLRHAASRYRVCKQECALTEYGTPSAQRGHPARPVRPEPMGQLPCPSGFPSNLTPTPKISIKRYTHFGSYALFFFLINTLIQGNYAAPVINDSLDMNVFFR